MQRVHGGWTSRGNATMGGSGIHPILVGSPRSTVGDTTGVPSGYVKIAIENGPVEIVEFPMKNGGSFQFAM